MKYASIDTGTNTLRLLIAEKDSNGRLAPLLYKRAITRLGGGYTPEEGMTQDAMERSISALSGFAALIRDYGVTDVGAVATSVVRRAVNREEFLSSVQERAGLEIEVIDGLEEARLTLLGVSSVIRPQPRRSLIMDIGGGSTEFVATLNGKSLGAWSLEMGVVSLTERFFRSDPPAESQLRGMEGEIKGVIEGFMSVMGRDGVDIAQYGEALKADFIGTAGTITTLAALDQDLAEYERDKINNYTLTKERIEYYYRYLSGLTIKEKEKLLMLEKGREDLIIPGAAITLIVLEAFGFSALKVSDAGLLEGLIIEKMDQTEVH